VSLPADASSSGAAAERLWGHRPPKVAGALGTLLDSLLQAIPPVADACGERKNW